jgi:hypothetical protein
MDRQIVGVDLPHRRLVRCSGALFPAPDDWRCPWLRINLLLREMTKLCAVREARPMLKEELNRAISMKAAMKTAPGWWS